MKAIALFSGGKDSTFAIHLASMQGFEIEKLVTVIVENRAPHLFHRPFAEYTVLQAEAMGIPIVVERGVDEEQTLVKALRRALEGTRATHLVVGALLSDFQRTRFAMVAEELGLKLFAPLWRKDQYRYMKELVEFGIEAMIVSITCFGLPLEWLGRVVDEKLVEEIARRARRYGFNPAFEGGEAETFVVNAPLFRFRICVDFEKVVLSEFEGFAKPLRVYRC